MKEHLQRIRAAVGRGASRTASALAAQVPDALMAAGIGAISYGSWLVYVPAGIIVGGVLVLVMGVLAARKPADKAE